MRAEDYSRRTEQIAGKPIAITTYKLGDVYHAKAEIDVIGAGARIAEASAPTRAEAEAKLLEAVNSALRK